MLLLMMMA
jgi:hypothetical protein